jgi:hypothetical protein
MVDHNIKDGYYIFKIYVPDGAVPKDVMKSKLLSSGNSRLAILDFAREQIELESIWYKCPDWEIEYGVDP